MNIRNAKPTTYDQKLKRIQNKLHKAFKAKDMDEYFWNALEYAHLEVSENRDHGSLSYLKHLESILHQRTHKTKETNDLSGLEALILGKLQKLPPSPDEQ